MDRIRKIFETFHHARDRIEIPLETVRRDLARFEGRIVLYGAGSAGIAFLHILRRAGIHPCNFSDGDPSKWGTWVEALEIVPPADIVPRCGEAALVIVTINTDGRRYCKSFDEALRIGGHTAVHRMLSGYGCRHVIDYTFFRRCHVLFEQEAFNLPSCSDVSLMCSHQHEIEEVYTYLSDEKSRDVFSSIVMFRLMDDSLTVPTEPQDNQYFETELVPMGRDEVFVDCGAFDGISLRTFLDRSHGCFEGYHGIEPDKANFTRLSAYAGTLPIGWQSRLHLYNAAAYSHHDGVTLYRLGGPGSFVSDHGNESVDTVMLDELLQDQPVSYIKMNIEGSELAALKGAEQILRSRNPKLAIAGYHRTEDLWAIPLQIVRCRPNCRLMLRSYMNHISFVYYAI